MKKLNHQQKEKLTKDDNNVGNKTYLNTSKKFCVKHDPKNVPSSSNGSIKER